MGLVIEMVANGTHDQLLLEQGEADLCLLGHLCDFMARRSKFSGTYCS